MKSFKKILAVLVAAACIFAVIPTGTAQAKSKDSIPSKIRSYTGDTTYTQINLSGKKKVKSVSTSDKNMYAKITYQTYNNENGEVSENSCELTTFCKKDGTYTVTLTFSDKSKSKITVYNYPSSIKSVKIDGKEQTLNATTASKCKVNVELEKGNTLEKLEYSSNKRVDSDNGYTTEEKLKTFKNGESIPLNQTPYAYKSEYSYSYEGYAYESTYNSEGLFASTYVVITYTDKYTKQKETESRYIASVIVP